MHSKAKRSFQYLSFQIKEAHFVLSRVIESKDETLPIGTKVVGPLGCRTHAVVPGKNLTKLDYLDGLAISIGVGAANMPGYDLTIDDY